MLNDTVYLIHFLVVGAPSRMKRLKLAVLFRLAKVYLCLNPLQ